MIIEIASQFQLDLKNENSTSFLSETGLQFQGDFTLFSPSSHGFFALRFRSPAYARETSPLIKIQLLLQIQITKWMGKSSYSQSEEDDELIIIIRDILLSSFMPHNFL